MARIFLAGATGAVGRRLVPLLLRAGHHVSAVARTAERAAVLDRQGARPLSLDLFDARATEAAVAGHEVVINLATHIPHGLRALFRRSWRQNDRLRSLASANLVGAALAAGAARYLQESVVAVYRDGGAAWLDELSPLDVTYHLRSALDAETAAQRFAVLGHTGVVLRFGYFYGLGAVHTVELARGLERGTAPLFGPPDAFTPTLYLDDAARAVVAALEVPSGTYNVVDDEPLTRRELVDTLAHALGLAPPKLLPAWVARLVGPVARAATRSLRVSAARFKEAARWTPEVPSVRRGWQLLAEQVREVGWKHAPAT